MISIRASLWSFTVLTLACGYARAEANWTAPTAAELVMTAEPKAPGASAILLSYEETDDSNSAEVTLHVRIKILTAGGFSAATVELPQSLVDSGENDQEIFARTIHRDGTVIPFKGTPQNSPLTHDGGDVLRVITFPDVEVGSILEYICHYRSQNNLLSYLVNYYAPVWHVQRRYFIKSEHFSLKAPTDKDPDFTRWVATLPPSAVLKRVKSNVVLDLADVLAIPDEELMPPEESIFYKVRFFFYNDTREKYWGTSGDRVDSVWSNFDQPHKAVTDAVHDLVLPSDSDEVKLHKIYTAVMQMENTDLTRRRTQRENKQNGTRVAKNSDDLWIAKRGDSWELTLLFVAMARAAGYEAHPMAVASRNQAVFDRNVLSWAQMDSMLAVVEVGGHNIFFDPGTRYCPFTRLAPWHANVAGISSDRKFMKLGVTPGQLFSDSRIERLADITLAADGSVSGTVKIGWLGLAGLPFRLKALREDRVEVDADMEKMTQSQMPPGIELKLGSLTGLTDGDAPLIATFTVSGAFGGITQKHMLLPFQLFESGSRPMFAAETRTQPIRFPDAYKVNDEYKLHLPPGFKVESLPESKVFRMASDIAYRTESKENIATVPNGGDTLIVLRVFGLNRVDYEISDYKALKSYFGQIASSNEAQIVLTRNAVPGTGN
ncbi:MAG TPA: DUF3857 domain-containing protein [Granulicella sp.]